MIEWYEPDEDTYTLIDCIQEEEIEKKIVVDLGTSTGAITNILHKHNLVLGIDTNRKALIHQKKDRNLVHMDLLECIKQDMVDIVIFNPPYVLYSDDPIIGGGVLGREVIDRFVRNLCVHTFYLLVIEANRYKEVILNIQNRGYKVKIKRVRRILGETIIILKGVKEMDL